MKIDKLIYTILRYLYEASDLSSPSMDPISAEALHVPIEQWNTAVAMLYKDGLVDGVNVARTKTGFMISGVEDLRITLRGIDYVHENSGFRKFMEAITGVSQILP